MLVITGLGSLKQKNYQEFKANTAIQRIVTQLGYRERSCLKKSFPDIPQDATEGQVKTPAAEECEWTPTCLDSK